MSSKAAKPKHSRQFSLRALMTLVTIVCITLAIPAGHLLLGMIAIWMIIGAVILLTLMTFQYPLYHILSGIKRIEKGDT